MAATINTNIPSMNAQRNLAYSGQSLNTTMQRLSSGLRVNSAKDDAAGLAIAERMNTQVRGLQVASRNANDGISLAQTAEGALGRIGDMMQRMRELTVQAGNATNSAGDRKALQAEVAQLIAEVDRVAKQTNFNGQKILDGSFAGAVFQVAANSGDNVTVGALVDTRTSQVSNVTYAKSDLSFNTKDTLNNRAISRFDEAIPAKVLKIRVAGMDPVELEKIEPANSSLERIGQVITAINNKSADTGVTAYMVMKPGTQEYDIAFMSSKLNDRNKPLDIQFLGFKPTQTGLGAGPLGTLDKNGVPLKIEKFDKTSETTKLPGDVSSKSVYEALKAVADDTMPPAAPGATAAHVQAITEKLNDLKDFPGFGATVRNELMNPASDLAKAVKAITVGSVQAAGQAVMTEIDNLATRYQTAVDAYGTYNGTAKEAAHVIAYGTALQTLTGDNKFPFNAANVTAETLAEAKVAIAKLESKAGFGGLEIQLQHHKPDQRGIDDINVSTQEGAWVALKKIDSAIDQVNGARATLGALQARFENTVNNIDIQVENLAAARGRIIDADFAKETANLSRTQILQQAGTSMVAQANQHPQQVLKLLGN